MNDPAWLRDLRHALGWTQNEMAKRVGSVPGVISRVELGKRPLTSKFRSRIMVAVRQAEMGR